jgi:serine/threonine protein kinase
MPVIPDRIGRYVVDRELGSGGMGEVYLAYSPAGSPVAVKVIRSDRLDPETRSRFEKEAEVARTVVGTNRVARFLDADPYADRPWLAMEYVEGRTLLDCIDSDGVLPASLVASLGALLVEGLEAVHAAGLLHRDLKPQNIVLGADGPMIIDFGLAAFMDASKESLSHSGMIIGSVRCMPPEQAGGHPRVTPAADVYALGTVLLYAAARHYPYDGTSWDAIALQVRSAEIAPDLSGVQAALVPLLTSMLAHEATDRPTPADVGERCAAVLAAAGKTPMAARHALIARTAGARTTSLGEPSQDVVDRIADTIEWDAGDLASPLDIAGGADQSASSDRPGTREEATATTAVPLGDQPQRSGRQSALHRVSQDLRTEYAARSAL